MTIDLAKIKSDAEKIAANSDLLLMALPVKDVLGMLAEIKRLQNREEDLTRLCEARFRINLDLEEQIMKIKEPFGVFSGFKVVEDTMIPPDMMVVGEKVFRFIGSIPSGAKP